MLRRQSELYNATFALGFAYNFFMALNFTNNAIYPLYVKQLGGTAETVGYFMGVASLAAIITKPLIGYMLDRIGVKPVLLLGSLTITLPSLGYLALINQGLNEWVWLLRLVHGFGFGAHFSAFFTLAAQVAPSHRRNEAIAMFGFSGLMANLIGPFIGELVYDRYGLPPFFLLVTGFGLVGVVLVFFLKLRPGNGSRTTPTLRGAFALLRARNLMLVYLLALLLSICYSSSQFFLSPHAEERGIGNFGLYFTGYAIAGMSIRLIGRSWGDRFGVRRLMIPAFLLYASGMFTIYFSSTTAMLFVAGLFSGSAHGLAFPAVNALGYSRAPEGYSGSVIAFLTGMMDVGSVLTAGVLGTVAEYYGYNSAFLISTFAGLSASFAVLFSVLRNPERVQTVGSK